MRTTGRWITVVQRTRVLVLSDSAMDRRVLSRRLALEPALVVGAGSDVRSARELVNRAHPDVIVLDMHLLDPEFATFLEELLASRPVPLVVLGSAREFAGSTPHRMLEGSVIEVVQASDSNWQELVYERLVQAVRRAASRPNQVPEATEPARQGFPGPTQIPDSLLEMCVIAIGASTGGTAAIETILRSMPGRCPPMVVCQHMPASFTAAFAERLDSLTDLTVREVDFRVELRPGTVAVAHGDRHLVVEPGRAGYEAVVRDGPPVHHQKPSVDVLFGSMAAVLGARCVGVLLTGMGQDGAAGLLEMREGGAHTIAQDEETSVVYGMPREAAEIGAAAEILPVGEIARAICRAAHGCLGTGLEPSRLSTRG